MKWKLKAVMIAVPLIGVVALAAWYLHGQNIPVLEPKGLIGKQERDLIIIGALLMIIVVVPVFSITAAIAWKYRAGNAKAKYSPEWDHSRKAETIWWGIPSVLILGMSILAWTSSHQLDPYKPIASNVKPVTIQVVALDWKWLFIYPEQHIATVNYLQFPTGTPVNFQITSDAPMNSFWIPQLGGQIYAMPGMSTQLHLMATSDGSYNGSSANISGVGFSGMKFVAKSTSQNDFNDWVSAVRQSPKTLSANVYTALAKDSLNNPTTYYSAVDGGIYDTVLMKYMMPMTGVAQ